MAFGKVLSKGAREKLKKKLKNKADKEDKKDVKREQLRQRNLAVLENLLLLEVLRETMKQIQVESQVLLLLFVLLLNVK